MPMPPIVKVQGFEKTDARWGQSYVTHHAVAIKNSHEQIMSIRRSIMKVSI